MISEIGPAYTTTRRGLLLLDRLLSGQVESTSPEDIVPVYGMHSVGYKISEEKSRFYQELSSTHLFPDIHLWPEDSIERTRQLNPSILAIDSLSFQPEAAALGPEKSDFWYLLPGNPFELRSSGVLHIIAADIPRNILSSQSLGPRSLESTQAYDMAHIGTNHFLEVALDGPIDFDINLPISGNSVKTYSAKTIGEWVVSNFGVGMLSLAYLATKPAFLNRRLSRKEFSLFGSLGVTGFLNSFRLMAGVVFNDIISDYNPLYSPLSSFPDIIDHYRRNLHITEFRNALIALKLEEAEQVLEDEVSPGPKVALMGDFHRYGRPVWNNTDIRNEVITGVLEEVFKTILSDNPDLATDRPLQMRVTDEVTSIFGGIAIYRVDDPPSELSPSQIAEQIPIVKSFISPIVLDLAQEASTRAGFDTDYNTL